MNSILQSCQAVHSNSYYASDNPGLTLQSIGDAAQLGWLLLNQNLISAAQLQTTLMNQAIYGKRLGDLLLEARLISTDQLDRALQEQTIRRKGHWVI